MRTFRLSLVAVVLSGALATARACEPCCPQRVDVTFHGMEARELPERIPFPEVRRLQFVDVRLTAERLERLLASTWVESVSIEGCIVGDEVCTVLARHASLCEVRLVGTQVTDEGLATLSRLDRLRTVDLRGTRVSAAGVAAFLESTGVEFVDVRGTGIKNVDALLAVRRGQVEVLANEPPDRSGEIDVARTREP